MKLVDIFDIYIEKAESFDEYGFDSKPNSGDPAFGKVRNYKEGSNLENAFTVNRYFYLASLKADPYNNPDSNRITVKIEGVFEGVLDKFSSFAYRNSSPDTKYDLSSLAGQWVKLEVYIEDSSEYDFHDRIKYSIPEVYHGDNFIQGNDIAHNEVIKTSRDYMDENLDDLSFTTSNKRINLWEIMFGVSFEYDDPIRRRQRIIAKTMLWNRFTPNNVIEVGKILGIEVTGIDQDLSNFTTTINVNVEPGFDNNRIYFLYILDLWKPSYLGLIVDDGTTTVWDTLLPSVWDQLRGLKWNYLL